LRGSVRLRAARLQLHQPAGRVVDESQQCARLAARLKLRMLRAIDLHQFTQALTTSARLMLGGETMTPINPESISDHPTA
jgi:hypothetical protein